MLRLEHPQWLAIAGVLLVLLGTFALALAAIALLLAWLRRYRMILVAAAAITALWLLTYVRLADIGSGLYGWGWVPLVLGTGCLFAAGLQPARRA